MHPLGAQVLKSMHPAAKMCTQGAGCTLNFQHCHNQDSPGAPGARRAVDYLRRAVKLIKKKKKKKKLIFFFFLIKT